MSAAPQREGLVLVPPGDPRARALLEGLHREYVQRYGPEIGAEEMEEHPGGGFAPPPGNRRPEAAALYRSCGYDPLPGRARVHTGGVYDVGCEKLLP